MLLAVLALLAQQSAPPLPSRAPAPVPAPTVGDTIVLSRWMAVDRPARIDAPPPPATGAIEPLEPPTVRAPALPTPAGDSVALITYRLVAWEAGALTVVLPQVAAVSADGRQTELPAETVVVRVAGVLPADSAVEPAPPRPFIPLRSADAVPVALAAAAGLLLIAGALLRGPRPREGRRRPSLAPPRLGGAELWVAAGEARALLDRASALLRRSEATGDRGGGRAPERPPSGPWDGRETAVTQLLDELDRSRFAARLDPALALRLARAAERLLTPPVPGAARR